MEENTLRLVIISFFFTVPTLAITKGTHYTKVCPNGIRPLLKDRKMYLQKVHGKLQERQCPFGTLFNPYDCMCSILADSLPYEETGSPLGQYTTTLATITSHSLEGSKRKESTVESIDFTGSSFGLSQGHLQNGQGDFGTKYDYFKQEITSVIDTQEVAKSNKNIVSLIGGKSRPESKIMVYNFYDETTPDPSPFLLDSLIGPKEEEKTLPLPQTKIIKETIRQKTVSLSTIVKEKKIKNDTVATENSNQTVSQKENGSKVDISSGKSEKDLHKTSSKIQSNSKFEATPNVKKPRTVYSNGRFSFKAPNRKIIETLEKNAISKDKNQDIQINFTTTTSTSTVKPEINVKNNENKFSKFLDIMTDKGVPRKYLNLFKDIAKFKVDLLLSGSNITNTSSTSTGKKTEINPKDGLQKKKSKNRISIDSVNKAKPSAVLKNLMPETRNDMSGKVKGDRTEWNFRLPGRTNLKVGNEKPDLHNKNKKQENNNRPTKLRLSNPVEDATGSKQTMQSSLSNKVHKIKTSTNSPRIQVAGQIRPWKSWSQAETKYVTPDTSAISSANRPVKKSNTFRSVENNFPLNKKKVTSTPSSVYKSGPSSIDKMFGKGTFHFLSKKIPDTLQKQRQSSTFRQANLQKKDSLFGNRKSKLFPNLLQQRGRSTSSNQVNIPKKSIWNSQNKPNDMFSKLFLKQNQNRNQVTSSPTFFPLEQGFNNLNTPMTDVSFLSTMMGSNSLPIQPFSNMATPPMNPQMPFSNLSFSNPFQIQSFAQRNHEPIDYADLIETIQNRRAGSEVEGNGDLNEHMRAMRERGNRMTGMNPQSLFKMHMQSTNNPMFARVTQKPESAVNNLYNLFSKTGQVSSSSGGQTSSLNKGATPGVLGYPFNLQTANQNTVSNNNRNRMPTYSRMSDSSSSVRNLAQQSLMSSLFGGPGQRSNTRADMQPRTPSDTFRIPQLAQPNTNGRISYHSMGRVQTSPKLTTPLPSELFAAQKNTGMRNFFQHQMKQMGMPPNVMKNMHNFING